MAPYIFLSVSSDNFIKRKVIIANSSFLFKKKPSRTKERDG